MITFKTNEIGMWVIQDVHDRDIWQKMILNSEDVRMLMVLMKKEGF